MYIEFPQYIRSGKNVDKQQKIIDDTSQYPFAKAGGYLTDAYELSCDDSRFCHFWLNIFGFGCKYIIILLLLLPVSDKTYPEFNELNERGNVYTSEH